MIKTMNEWLPLPRGFQKTGLNTKATNPTEPESILSHAGCLPSFSRATFSLPSKIFPFWCLACPFLPQSLCLYYCSVPGGKRSTTADLVRTPMEPFLLHSGSQLKWGACCTGIQILSPPLYHESSFKHERFKMKLPYSRNGHRFLFKSSPRV